MVKGYLFYNEAEDAVYLQDTFWAVLKFKKRKKDCFFMAEMYAILH